MNKIEKVTLAALLHDIGKFRQRALDPSHNHQWHSRKFILELAREESGEIKRDLEDIAEMTSKHHDPDTPLARFIRDADWITAAQEREEGRYSERRDVSKQPMLSIFSMIMDENTSKEKYYSYTQEQQSHAYDNREQNSSDENTSKEKYYSYTPLEISKKLEPVDGRRAEVELEDAWMKFAERAKRIGKENFDTFLFSLLYLLKKYTFFIPSATYGGEEKTIVPDVSLFYHLSTTAAFANCIYRFEMEKGTGVNFLLIFGDISGLQDFIYTISSKRALRSLKGRSICLELLNRASAYKILAAIELPITNLISCSPGSFIILAPNLEKVEEKLIEVRKEINRNFLEEFGGDIYFSIGWISFDKNRAKEIVEVIDEAKKKVEENKRRRFSELLDEIENEEGYKKFFILTDPKKRETCDVCKRDYKPEEIETDEEGVKKCKSCREFEELASWLRNTDYLIEVPEFKEKFIKERRLELKRIGIRVLDTFFLFKPRQMNLKDIISAFSSTANLHAYRINSTDFESNFDMKTETNVGYGFDFFATYAPEENKRIKDFEELAKESEGTKRIGILRMDVDNLGKIFSGRRIDNRHRQASIDNWHGWASWDLTCRNEKCRNYRKKVAEIDHKNSRRHCDICGEELDIISKMTPARYSTLSSLMNIFFHACVDKICSNGGLFSQKDLGKGDLYLIYSGGDDLFLVGSWNKVYEAALRIKEEFDTFVGRNPNITISASLLDVHRKIPVHRFAEHAKNELEKAKNRKADDKIVKNAISIFGIVKSWKSFHDLHKLKNHLHKMINEKKLSRRFLHFLFRLDEEAKKEPEPISRVRALALYHFSRFEEQGMKTEELKEEIFKLIKNDLYIPVRWAEMLTRKEVPDNEKYP